MSGAALTAEATLRHIHHKVASRELDPGIAERMIAVFHHGPGLSYRELEIRAVARPLPDIAFHVTDPSHRDSILASGLFPADPRAGWRGDHALGQPAAVYVSDSDEASDGRHSHSLPYDIWQIAGLHTLAPTWSQDRLNPTCWAIHAHIPPSMLTALTTITTIR